MTFYRYPKSSLVEKWRREAPADFEFTVKAHQDISHRFRLGVNKECLDAFGKMKEICDILKSRVLLIQTAGSFKPSTENFGRLIAFFGKIDRGGLTIAWESRGPEWERPDIKSALAKELAELEVIHVTDPLRTMPAHVGDVAYFRLHGLGARLYYYQYKNAEMADIARRVEGLSQVNRAYFFFNNLAMWVDAQRFLHFTESGKFPPLASSFGLSSAMEVLAKVRYPVNKDNLSRSVGWRLVEWDDGGQLPLDVLLRRIPNKKYERVEGLLEEIRKAGLA